MSQESPTDETSTETSDSWLAAVGDLGFDLASEAPGLGSFLALVVVALGASLLRKLGWSGWRRREPRRSRTLWERDDHDRPG